MLPQSKLDALAGHSRVWIYMAERSLTDAEIKSMAESLDMFCTGWAAHGQSLSAAGAVLHARFVILAVDEQRAGASGCSIDKSLHFIEHMERQYGLSLTDRQLVAYRSSNEIRSFHLNELENLVKSGILTNDSLIFDNLVPTLHDLRTRWLAPAQHTWLRRFWPKENLQPAV